MIVISKKNGDIRINKKEIELFIQDQVEIVPGVIQVGSNHRINKLRKLLNLKSNGIKIEQLNKNQIIITLSLILSKENSYEKIEEEIKNILEYSLEKKYGLKIELLDVLIQDIV